MLFMYYPHKIIVLGNSVTSINFPTLYPVFCVSTDTTFPVLTQGSYTKHTLTQWFSNPKHVFICQKAEFETQPT